MMIAIYALLEWLDPDAPDSVYEPFGFAVPVGKVGTDQLFDDVGNLVPRERGADHLAEGRRRARAGEPLVSADGNLIPLLAVLVDAQDPDVTDVVVAAGIHTAGNVEVQLAYIVLIVEVVEALLDRLRHGNRLRVGKRAEISPRAGDDVRDKPDIGTREPKRLYFTPQSMQLRLAHIGKDQVLLVRNAQFAHAVAVGKIRHCVHLVGCNIAWRNARLLERQRHRGIAGHLVRMNVALRPGRERRLRSAARNVARVLGRESRIGRSREAGFDALDLFP